MKKLWIAGAVAACFPFAAVAVQGTFGQYVHSVVAGGMLDQAGVYSVAALAGVLVHYMKQYQQFRIEGSVWSYFVKQKPWHTLFMVTSQVAVAASAGFTGAWDQMSWGTLLISAFTTGYALDSMTNSADPVATTADAADSPAVTVQVKQ